MIYLDNASTTRVDDRVLEAMLPYLRGSYGNAGGLYRLGRESAKAIAAAREQVAKLIHAQPEQILFTSGGSEANSMVFMGLRETLLRLGKRHVVTSQIEHDSVLKAVRGLTKYGFHAEFVAPKGCGEIDPRAVSGAITGETGLVSIMHTNNETGIRNPVDRIAQLAHDSGALFHSDCVQAAGFSNLDVRDMDCDFLSLSAHKLHAPKGIGALYVKDRGILSPIIYGGGAQEFGLRGGTENVAGIVGFGEACKILRERLADDRRKILGLKQVFYEALTGVLRERGLSGIFHLNGGSLEESGKVLNFHFDNVDGETLLLCLDTQEICVSAGSACRSHESEPSHVLTAMRIDREEARNSIRVSFSRMNTETEAQKAGEIIADTAALLYHKRRNVPASAMGI